MASAASSNWRRRSGSMGAKTIVGGQLEREHERLAQIGLPDGHVIDDDEFGRALQLVEELPEAFVLALEHEANLQAAEPRVLLDGRVGLVPGLLVLDVRLAREPGQRGVREPARGAEIGG